MTQPTSAVSLRITEEDLALLDARVGMDGARNRSDVVRLAIQEFLHNQPLLADMKSIRIPLGRSTPTPLGPTVRTAWHYARACSPRGSETLHQASGCRNETDRQCTR